MTGDARSPSPGDIPDDDATLPPPATSPGDDATLPPRAIVKSEEAVSVGDKVRDFGDYQLLTEIARGGMGVVYKAR